MNSENDETPDEDKSSVREDTGSALEDEGSDLEDVAKTEHQYLHERLRQELGREPTEEELDEWLRRHTEGY